MLKEIIVNVGADETRVAVLEDQVLMELYIERSQQQRLVGNIYKGRVENVLPGMQAAFVDIGLEKNAFLYVEEAVVPPKFSEECEVVLPKLNIGDVVKSGQELVVQITKEPIGTKGPRVTTHITLPGRYVVLMPNIDYVGISRRIEDEETRERLRMIAEGLKPLGMGLIIRTVADGVDEEELRRDVELLVKLWHKIRNRSLSGPVPNLIHKDLNLVQRILRDHFTDEVDRLIVDCRQVYDKINEFLELMDPRLRFKVQLKEDVDLFSSYNLEAEIEKVMRRRVWLKCGGYLVIDQTEALTVIDVNTGKFVGSRDLEDTVVKTNLDAAREIARQLRVRNIGGIIIIDFIDMVDEEHRQQVLAVLEEELKRDKTKAHILGITQLGLVELTRKKVRQDIEGVVQKVCPYCDGRGKVLAEDTVAIKVRRALEEMLSYLGAKAVLIEVHPAVAALLIGPGGSALAYLETKYGRKILIRGCQEMHIESFELKPINTEQELEDNMAVKLGGLYDVKVEEPHATNQADAIARIQGLVVDIEQGGAYIGQKVSVEITRVYKTYAKARVRKVYS